MPIRGEKHMTITEAHPYHRQLPGDVVEVGFEPKCPLCREKAARDAGPALLDAVMTDVLPLVHTTSSQILSPRDNCWSRLAVKLEGLVGRATNPPVLHPKPKGELAGFGPGEEPNLGMCCGCGTTEGVRNVVELPFRSATPDGATWGCVVCGAKGGAVAVACDECVRTRRSLVYVLGWAHENRRGVIPEKSHQVPVRHDMEMHPEVDDPGEIRQEHDA